MSFVIVAVPETTLHVPPTGVPVNNRVVPSHSVSFTLVMMGSGSGTTTKLTVSSPAGQLPDAGAAYSISMISGLLILPAV